MLSIVIFRSRPSVGRTTRRAWASAALSVLRTDGKLNGSCCGVWLPGCPRRPPPLTQFPRLRLDPKLCWWTHYFPWPNRYPVPFFWLLFFALPILCSVAESKLFHFGAGFTGTFFLLISAPFVQYTVLSTHQFKKNVLHTCNVHVGRYRYRTVYCTSKVKQFIVLSTTVPGTGTNRQQ